MTPRFSSLAQTAAVAFLLVATALPLGAVPSAWAAPKKAPYVVPARDDNAALSILVDEAKTVMLKAPAVSVFIANPEIADIQVSSPTSLMVFGKKTGQTTLIATDDSGRTLLHKKIDVTQDLTDLRRALREILPKSHVGAETVPGGIVLTGEVRDAAAAEDARRLAMRYIDPKQGEVINRIKVRSNNQIHIRVRFAEVSRDIDKRLGIDWESIGNVGAFSFGLATGETVLSDGANLLNRARPVTDQATNDIFSFSGSNKHFNINGMIDALAKDGLVTILAEPNLTAMSGETASFLAGGEFPVPVPQNLNTITIEWKQYGVSLAFTPTLVGDSRINLHVRPEVSQLSDSGAITLESMTIPGLVTRRAETTIELGSGQSFAIGGLLNNNQTQSLSKYPFLGDLPILGTLFRSTRFQSNQSELVIIITPYIVKPAASPDQMALPTDGFAAPSDVDLLTTQRMSSSDPNARPLSGHPVATFDEAPAPSPAPVALPEKAVLPPPPVESRPAPEKKAQPQPVPPPPPVPSDPAAPPKPADVKEKAPAVRAIETDKTGGYILE